MGGSHRKPKVLLIPGRSLSYDEVILTLKKNLSITTDSNSIEYLLIEGRQYQAVARTGVEKLLDSPDLEEYLIQNQNLAIFQAFGNFRTTVWGGARRYTCYFFIDNKKMLWIIDLISRSIEILRYPHQIDRISSL